MTPFEEFEALGRIFTVIKTYRQQQGDDLHPTNNDLIEAYLVNHLTSQDLKLWLRLEAQDSLMEFLHHERVNGELSQFRRATHGLSNSWRQSHNLN